MSRIQMVLDEVDSTQLEMKRQFAADAFLENYSFVHAYEQSAGRGRQERAWYSARGNLYLSVLLRAPFESITWTPHRMAVAMAESLLQIGIPESRLAIKWPNDIWIDGEKKISGILCEKVGENIVAGIGVNILLSPKGLGRPVTSVKEVLDDGGPEGLSEDSIVQIRDQFIEELSRLTNLREVQKKYERYSLFKKGDFLRWQDEGSTLIQEGRFLKIGEFGEMIVQINATTSTPSLGEKKLFSEEVHLLK